MYGTEGELEYPFPEQKEVLCYHLQGIVYIKITVLLSDTVGLYKSNLILMLYDQR